MVDKLKTDAKVEARFKASAPDAPSFDEIVRDMKQADVQTLLGFLVEEVSTLSQKVDLLQK